MIICDCQVRHPQLRIVKILGKMVPPVSLISASPQSGIAPLSVSFSGINSYDPDGIITSYKWNFGEGSTASGENVSKTFTYEVVYTVSLTVSDDLGAVHTSKIRIDVQSDDNNGNDCESPILIDIPFVQNGAGKYCWFISQEPSYVNSWNLDLLEINGVDYTNTWSNTFPATIDGGFYIRYTGNYDWSHFEIPEAKSAGFNLNQP